jgi:hypothetical protein
VHQLSGEEIAEAENSFRHFPLLVSELTDGRASVEYTVHHIDRALDTLTQMPNGNLWPWADDTRAELDAFAAPGTVDSIFVFWPQHDLVHQRSIPSYGWGYGTGASADTNGATYATVANARAEIWRLPRIGEVWLHEWLHGVCHHFAQRGHVMPDGDADGGDRHGYVHSPTNGWSDYYRDLMNGRVAESGECKGIASVAWLEETPPRTMIA